MVIGRWGLLGSFLAFSIGLKAQCSWTEGTPNTYTDSVKKVETRFFNQIQVIAANPCKQGGIVFTGSSSIRLWKNIESSFPDLPVCNTGFGGSTLPELLKYLPELILNHKPKGLVIYCGENDISLPYSTVSDVVGQFKLLFDTLNFHLPSIPVWFISVKPSLLSRHFLEKQNCVNNEIKSILTTDKTQRWEFVDVRSPMLNEEGEPRPDLFLRDGLHMNENGYKIWQEQLQTLIYPKWEKR
ncbi:MAG: G-D-S-L family lipolytic protein [Bacteroidetes bacterium]|nr:G-D-S-L family lipolytic protein [Bacteroidota bacterium]